MTLDIFILKELMFVYMTVCLSNNKKYIGKYEGSEKDNYLGSGKLLKRAVAKYGKENFERIVLAKYNSKDECREGEKKWIELFDAVKAKDFYNIASGGEGGNTFAGIQGEARIKLIAKLKLRKRPVKVKGVTTVYNVETQTQISVSIEEFLNNNFLLGINCKGLYITPGGIFCSSLTASRYNEGLDFTSLAKRCKNANKQVSKAHLCTDKRLTKEDLGKTFTQLKYGFVDIKDVNIEFLRNNKIIKQ